MKNLASNGGLVYLDEEHLLFYVGRRIAVLEIQSNEMTFLPEWDFKVKRVVSSCISSNRKYLAQSENTDSHGQVNADFC